MPTPHYGQPRYRVIADELRQRIESGTIPRGTLLPTESALVAEFRVSRGTIRQAMAALRKDGLVATEHGRGTYATATLCECNPIRHGGAEVRQRKIPADAHLAAVFDIKLGALLVETESVTRENGRVVAVAQTYRLYLDRAQVPSRATEPQNWIE
ncbi:GntR family transcriptional regulator [Micromonospora sp. S-DT3-3-22]|uniref:GntR family transcriptional regulator n=1 Tax=Micromonospora sp. S-DT3-3-22 TaxID=2755359 RepID=UPI00188DF3A6